KFVRSAAPSQCDRDRPSSVPAGGSRAVILEGLIPFSLSPFASGAGGAPPSLTLGISSTEVVAAGGPAGALRVSGAAHFTDRGRAVPRAGTPVRPSDSRPLSPPSPCFGRRISTWSRPDATVPSGPV